MLHQPSSETPIVDTDHPSTVCILFILCANDNAWATGFMCGLRCAVASPLLLLFLFFLLLCFSCFFAFLLLCFCWFSLFCFSAFLLLCFCAFLLLLFPFLHSCVFAALPLPAALLRFFAVSLLFFFFCFILSCLYSFWDLIENLTSNLEKRTDTFTRKCFYTQTLLLHTKAFIHTDAFTHRSCYAQGFLQTDAPVFYYQNFMLCWGTCAGQLKISMLPQFLTIEAHFVRNCRIFIARCHRAAFTENRNSQKREGRERERETENERQREREKRMQDLKMWDLQR